MPPSRRSDIQPTDDRWNPTLQVDEDADDSDKIFTVTAAKEWQILWIWVELTTTSDAGNRQLEVLIRDAADDMVFALQAGTVQAASLTRNYLLAAGLPDLLAFRDTSYLMTPLPSGLILPAGYDVRIYDNNAVDADGDDLVIQMMVAERDGR